MEEGYMDMLSCIVSWYVAIDPFFLWLWSLEKLDSIRSINGGTSSYSNIEKVFMTKTCRIFDDHLNDHMMENFPAAWLTAKKKENGHLIFY